MTTSRYAYRIDQNNPGSDLAGETAAAMAAASIVFHRSNPAYSRELLNHAYQLFDFADKYRGKYDSSITVAQKYYRSVSGYADELLWAAAWIYKATNNQYYLDYLGKNGDALGGTGWAMTEFGWDVKYAGVQTLVAKFLMGGKAGSHAQVDYILGDNPRATSYMVGYGNNYPQQVHHRGSSIVSVKVNPSFVTCRGGYATWFSRKASDPNPLVGAIVGGPDAYDNFADHRDNYEQTEPATYNNAPLLDLHCSSGSVAPSELLAFAKSQVDYILGDNPRATSYMVGYGNNYPQQVHHRGSSIVSVKVNPSFVTCRGGYATWFSRKASDPNPLVGAIVGGPDAYDNFADHRDNYEQTEPATYNNAPLLGVLARLHGGHGGYNQLLPVEVPVAKPIAAQPKPVAAHPKPNPVKETSISAPIAIEQKTTTSWVANGKTYYRYSAIKSQYQATHWPKSIDKANKKLLKKVVSRSDFSVNLRF
nr:endoglucanase 6-like [Tanacetum cinerariifolium]